MLVNMVTTFIDFQSDFFFNFTQNSVMFLHLFCILDSTDTWNHTIFVFD